jgi:histidine triad (HIT) family protein
MGRDDELMDCIFCSIVAGDIPADIVLRTDDVVAFRDIQPGAPTHILLIPTEHHSDAASVAQADPALAGALLAAAGEVAASEGLEDYRLIFNTGAGAGQTVFHAHLHLMGGRAMSWPPG